MFPIICGIIPCLLHTHWQIYGGAFRSKQPIELQKVIEKIKQGETSKNAKMIKKQGQILNRNFIKRLFFYLTH